MLTALQEEMNAIDIEHEYHEKLRKKHSESPDSKVADEKDLEKLIEISKQQKLQIKQTLDDIQALRLKIKPRNQLKLFDRTRDGQNSPKLFTFTDFGIDAEPDSEQSQITRSSSSEVSSEI